MTRWARGKDANKKKPLEASDWSEMKSVKIKKTVAESVKPNDAVVETVKATDSSHSKRKLLDASDQVAARAAKKVVLPSTETISGCSLVDELEQPTKKAPRVQTCVLEEFERKDNRREARRLKRQDVKMQMRVCFNCRQPGHELASCPLVVKDVEQGTGVCFKCGSTEHKIQQCTAKVPQGKFPYAKCFICGETGHLSRSCPDNPKGLYPNGGCCNECGSVEHFKKDCPELQKHRAVADTTLPVLDSRTNVDEDPSLKSTPVVVTSKTKNAKVVKF